MTKTVQTAIVGVTGYAGAELARLLLHHPRLQASRRYLPGAWKARTSNAAVFRSLRFILSSATTAEAPN